MLKLRKLLLCNYFYYLFIVLVIIVSLIRLAFPKESNYHPSSTSFTGIITNLIIKDDKLTIYLQNKETVIATYKFKENNNLQQLELGDKLIVTGSFKRARKNTTKHLFNYQKYLERKNIFYLIEVSSLTKLSHNKNPYYYLKQKLITRLDYHPYLFTFILGDKTYLDSTVKRSYQENGISHLFAISGMHITLLTSLISRLLKRLRASEHLHFRITLAILFCYLLLTGLSPSILRGVLFYCLFSLNNIHYFYIKPLNIFLTILGITLLINPNYLFDVGFQYSYLISFTLLISTNYLTSPNYFESTFKVSVLSFLVSIPITIYNFYQLNILGIIYNLFFVPFVSNLIFPLAILCVFFKPILPIFNLSTNILEAISLAIDKISFGKIIFQRIPLPIYFIYLFLIISYLFKHNHKYLFFYLGILLIHYLLPIFNNTTYLKMIDIGQGDSILLRSKNQTVLVDTGGISSYGNSNRDGEIYYNTISPLLKSLGIKRLDYLVLTHGDKDHLGEAKTIISNMPVKRILLNDNRINYYEQQLIRKNTMIAKQGLSFTIGKLNFIQLNENLKDENDSSQIYLVSYNNLRLLLTGDASIKSEELLLENYDLGKIDILKVGHHGSKTSTSSLLLKKIRPNIALISSGKDNKFNHPHLEVLERLKKYHLRIYNTQTSGTITINLDKLTIMTDI